MMQFVEAMEGIAKGYVIMLILITKVKYDAGHWLGGIKLFFYPNNEILTLWV
jgi:hypothetical protein